MLDKLAIFELFNYHPHKGQLAIHNSRAKYRTLACGARYGKSIASAYEAIAAMFIPNSLGWVVAPTYDLATIIFRQILLGWQTVRPDAIETYSESRMYIRTVWGAECYGKSAENPVSLLGRGLDWMIFDECANSKEEVWSQYLQPRLIDRKGWALFPSTPKGKGWFYHLCMRAKTDPEYYFQEGPTWDNPVIDKEWLQAQKPNYTERWWQQEVLGAFLDDTGSVFRNIRTHISGVLEQPNKTKSYSIGVDLAKHQDWTVITVMDMQGRVVHWERLEQGMAYPQQQARIADVIRRYNNATTYMDSSGVGDPIVDYFLQSGLPVIGVPTAQEKTALVDSLVLAMEGGKIAYPDIPTLINELEIFEHEKTSTGRARYNAPIGFHDDAVISLALAWRGVNTGGDWGVASGGY